MLPQPLARIPLPFISQEPLPQEFKRLEAVYQILQKEYIDQSKLEIDVMNTVVVSVVLSDADGTTQMDGSVNGLLMAGGN